MHSFDILDPNTEIFGHFFLEASAGTGKTFAIEHLVVRLLLRDEHALDISQILIVTFTRAATRELKMRIRQNLEKAIESLRLEEGASYLHPYFANKRESLRKLQKALIAFESAPIFTIHGFCHRMLTDFAFEASSHINLNEPEDASYKGLLRQTIKDFLRTELNEELCTQEELALLLKKFRDDSDGLIEMLIRLIENRGKLSVSEKERNATQILFSIAAKCKSRWENKPFREKVSPDEILTRMHDCLANPSFAMKVAHQYEAAIIDEFQDTDPTQWQIFKTLFVQTRFLPVLYLVGDPKQSIYAFRSADIYTYLNAAETIGRKHYLDTNYRSESSLLGALNAFFSSASWCELPSLEQTLPFHPVKSSHQSGDGSLHFFVAESQPTREKKWPSTSLEENVLFPFIAEECGKFTKERIAVLVKDRYQAERLHLFFKKYNISSMVKQGENLKESREFLALESILLAAENPLDVSLVKKALSSSLIQWTAEDIISQEKLTDAKRYFYELHLLVEKGFASFFQKLGDLFPLPKSSRLRRLVELFLSSGRDPLPFVRELKRSEEILEYHEEEEPQDIMIMTTHMSKGLEFDCVFALGVASRHAAKEEFVRAGDHIIPYNEEDPLCQKALRELEAEKLRQLYVAMTRAKRHLYLPVILDKGKETSLSPLELFLYKALDGRPNKERMELFIEKLSKFGKVETTFLKEKMVPIKRPEKPHTLELSIEIPSVFKQETIYSFSTLSRKHAGEKASPLPEELPLGAETGTRVHGILEKIFQRGFNHPFESKKCEQLIQVEIEGTFLQDWEKVLMEMVTKALHLPLKHFCLADIPSTQILQETEFLYPLDGKLIKGFADLCFHWEGEYFLLDWKTNWLENYSQNSMEKAMEDCDYFLQASLYSDALKRYVKLFDTPLEFGGAYYCFLRGPAFYHFRPLA